LHHSIDHKRLLPLLGGILIYLMLIEACAMPASSTGMIPTSFETVRKHTKSVRISVTGGQESEAVGRPHIQNDAFARALVESIARSQTFSKVVEDQSKEEDYLLSVTLFSMDKRAFGDTVKLEIGWTLRRADTQALTWQESITSEYTDSNVQIATEGAARNNIAQALGKISRLNL
jgi:hypothetical protein